MNQNIKYEVCKSNSNIAYLTENLSQNHSNYLEFCFYNLRFPKEEKEMSIIIMERLYLMNFHLNMSLFETFDNLNMNTILDFQSSSLYLPDIPSIQNFLTQNHGVIEENQFYFNQRIDKNVKVEFLFVFHDLTKPSYFFDLIITKNGSFKETIDYIFPIVNLTQILKKIGISIDKETSKVLVKFKLESIQNQKLQQ